MSSFRPRWFSLNLAASLLLGATVACSGDDATTDDTPGAGAAGSAGQAASGSSGQTAAGAGGSGGQAASGSSGHATGGSAGAAGHGGAAAGGAGAGGAGSGTAAGAGAAGSGGEGGTESGGTSSGGTESGGSSGSESGGSESGGSAGQGSGGKGGAAGKGAAGGAGQGGKGGASGSAGTAGAAGGTGGSAGKGGSGGSGGSAGKAGSGGSAGAPDGTTPVLGLNLPNDKDILPYAVANAATLKVHYVRVYVSIIQWVDDKGNKWSGGGKNTGSPFYPQTLESIKAYVAKGYHVTAALVPNVKVNGAFVIPGDGINTDQVRGLVDYVMADKDMQGVDLWELGNEPNGKGYWSTHDPNKDVPGVKADVEDFTRRYIIPAAKEFHVFQREVTNAPPSYSTDNAPYLETILSTVDPSDKTRTCADYMNYANLHLYANTGKDMASRVKWFSDHAHGLPMVSTEWSVDKQSSDDAWADAIEVAWPAVRDKLAIAHYYIWDYTDSTHGKDGLILPDDTIAKKAIVKHQPFYDKFAGLK